MKLDVPVIVLDFETFYDKGYSLGKLGIVKYVFDKQFRVHGLAVMREDEEPAFRTDVAAALRELQEAYGERLERALVVMHNAYFDAFVLFHSFGLSVRNVVDTKCLAHLVNGPQQPADLADLAKYHGLPLKGTLDFMQGVRTPSNEQLVQLAEYAKRDLLITRRLFDLYFPVSLRTPPELAIAAHAVRMFSERPFTIAPQAIEQGRTSLEAYVDERVAATGHSLKEVSGNKTFEALMRTALARTGRQVPLKLNGNRSGFIPAFSKKDEAMVALLEDDDEAVRQLAHARLAVRSRSQQLSRFTFLEQCTALCDGLAHLQVKYHGCVTGRFTGSGGFSVQNIADPARCTNDFERQVATALREAICARDGCMLVASDAAQIEARVLAWLSPEAGLLEAFSSGSDVYCTFASKVFRRTVRVPSERASDYGLMKSLRTVGKTAVLALGYGMGRDTFIARLKQSPEARRLFADGTLTSEVCQQTIDEYRRTFAGIPRFWHRCERAFRDAVFGRGSRVGRLHFMKKGDDVFIELPSGRRLRYAGAKTVVRGASRRRTRHGGYLGCRRQSKPQLVYTNLRNGTDTHLFGAKIVENVTQAVARDILVHTIIAVERQGWPVVTHCHDEIVCEVEVEHAQECMSALEDAWRSVPEWADGLVLDAESVVGGSFADIK